MNERCPERLRDDPAAREQLLGRLDRYLDAPLALVSLALVLITVIELTGEVSEPWQGRRATLGRALWSLFPVEIVAKFAPVKRRYLRHLSTGATSPTKTAERMSTAPKIWTATSLSPASQ
jgi:hypothetical protein